MLGAQLAPVSGWEMPLRFTDAVEEHRAARTSAAVFDTSEMFEFRVFGFGAFDFLQQLFSSDLSKIAAVGAGQ
ncbi:MAG: glycine cleavage system protein T, partial [Coriobacteriales bacterium]|nr:glycine cleavage system protein T [Coriobacteriales bacterium]